MVKCASVSCYCSSSEQLCCFVLCSIEPSISDYFAAAENGLKTDTARKIRCAGRYIKHFTSDVLFYYFLNQLLSHIRNKNGNKSHLL